MALADLAAAIKQAYIDSGANAAWAGLDAYALNVATAIWNHGASTGGGWVTDLDIDFSALPAQQFLTDGTYTIAGIPWFVAGRHCCSLAANGFEIDGDLHARGPADSGGSGPTDTSSWDPSQGLSLGVMLTDACPGLRLTERLRVAMLISYIAPQGDYNPAWPVHRADLCVIPDIGTPQIAASVIRRNSAGATPQRIQASDIPTFATMTTVPVNSGSTLLLLDLLDGIGGVRRNYCVSNQGVGYTWPASLSAASAEMTVNSAIRQASIRMVNSAALVLVFPMMDDSPPDRVSIRRVRIDRFPETGP